MDNKIISPCISICRTDPVTGYCYGCARTNEEKRQWKEENSTNKWKENNLKIIEFDKINAKKENQTKKKLENLSDNLFVKIYNLKMPQSPEIINVDNNYYFVNWIHGDLIFVHKDLRN